MCKLRLFVLAVLALTTLALGSTAYADTVTVGDLTFTATVTGTKVTLDIQCTSNVSTCKNWFIGDVTLKGFTFTSLGSGTAPAGFLDTLQNGGQNNKGVGNGGGCNGTQGGMAVCWDAKLPLGTKLGTGVNVFTANITGGVVTLGSDLHVQATGYNNAAGNQKKGGKVFAVSNDLEGGGGGTSVPEPGTFPLLAGGLIGLALLSRKALLA